MGQYEVLFASDLKVQGFLLDRVPKLNIDKILELLSFRYKKDNEILAFPQNNFFLDQILSKEIRRINFNTLFEFEGGITTCTNK
jgi:hypothetical protein